MRSWSSAYGLWQINGHGKGAERIFRRGGQTVNVSEIRVEIHIVQILMLRNPPYRMNRSPLPGEVESHLVNKSRQCVFVGFSKPYGAVIRRMTNQMIRDIVLGALRVS